MDNHTNGPRPTGEFQDQGAEATPIFDTPYTDEELYKMARNRVRARSALIIHVVAYLAVNTFLFFLAISSGRAWNFYVLGGWGIGLACHLASYFLSATPESVHHEYMRQKQKYRG